MPSLANAQSRPFVVYEDDGTLAKGPAGSVPSMAKKVLARYDEAGKPRPDVLSVWSSFKMGSSDVPTYVLPLKNDVTGIGFEKEHPGDGTFDEKLGTRAVLLHNNVLALDKRAKLAGSPLAGFAEYLFLLELSHLWGPAARLPTELGVPSDALIGFTYHWSFFVDGGGSAAGGTVWLDKGGGLFATKQAMAADLGYSMLDLYLMGLVGKQEVPPFAVLKEPVLQGKAEDPYSGAEVDAQTFPWFSADPVTVKATRVPVTIDDVIKANGPRVPDVTTSPKSFTLGIALVIPAGTSAEQRAEHIKAMTPVANALAPAFARATGNRGTLQIVTTDADPVVPDTPATEEPAAPAPAAPAPAAAGPSQPSDGGCSLVGAPGLGGSWALGLPLALFAWRRRRIRARYSPRP
jgi:hypothetical protein